MKAIEVRNLTKTFGDLVAVDGLSVEVDKGEIFGIVGPDGAGKTTFLRIVATIMDPDSGSIYVAGFDAGKEPFKIKDNLAYMSQRFGLYPDLTVDENINFYADLYGLARKNREPQIVELLGFSQMEPFRQRKAGDLSGGMKQKLQLICALIHTPKVLLLDEPTNGVDPVSRRDFWRILHGIAKQGVAIVVATAYLDEAERCDRVGLLDRGKFLATGSPREIKGDFSTLEQLFVSIMSNKETTADYSRATAKSSVTSPLRAPLISSAVSPGVVFHGVPSSNAVEVDKLTRVFGRFIAVDAISFKVAKGEIFGFLGPNGAGKSTTIRMLCGLLSPSSGKGVVAGYDILTQTELIKQNIGYMSQKFSLYEDLTVEENIQFYGGIYGLSGRAMDRRKAWALKMADLENHGRSMTKILSVGWKQRLALACAILHEPPILFLDEPTSGVDPVSRRRFWDLIHAMADNGVTVFVTTHHMEEAEHCDRIAMIYRGRMIAMGTPMDLKNEHIHDTILDLRCSTPQNIIELVQGLPGVRDASFFGAGLHVATTNAAIAEENIRQKLESRSIEGFTMKKIQPTMEDLFISLIEEDDQKNRAGHP